VSEFVSLELNQIFELSVRHFCDFRNLDCQLLAILEKCFLLHIIRCEYIRLFALIVFIRTIFLGASMIFEKVFAVLSSTV